jgi:hypothetical protein
VPLISLISATRDIGKTRFAARSWVCHAHALAKGAPSPILGGFLERVTLQMIEAYPEELVARAASRLLIFWIAYSCYSTKGGL